MYKYKAVFFDWDGTLVKQSDLIAESHNYVRNHFGVDEYDSDQAKFGGHKSTRELYPLLFGDSWKEAEQVFWDYFYERHLSDVNPFTDSRTFLDSMTDLGIPTGVVSNKRHVFLTREIDHIEWTPYFSAIVGAGEAEKDKPSAAPLIMATKATDPALKNTDILYIGDTETDMKCAGDMGCDFALILRGRNMDDLIRTYKPYYVYDTLQGLMDELEKSNNNPAEKKAC